MDAKKAEFQKRLLETFRAEAAEHLAVLSTGLVRIEKEADREGRRRLTEEIFREAHSLKGAARAVGLRSVESVCQSLEGFFALWKRGELAPEAAQMDALLHAVDTASRIITENAENTTSMEAAREAVKRIDDMLAAAHAGAPAPPPPPPVAAPNAAPAAVDTLRIKASTLEAAVLQAEQLTEVKLAFEHHAREAAAIAEEMGRVEREADGGRPDPGSLRARVSALASSLEGDRRVFQALVDDLMDRLKRAAMTPIGPFLEGFRRPVRDLAQERGKEAALVLSGGEMEADRRILEGLRDPLLHILRNCVDHGIEAPEVRARAGKPAAGAVSIAVARASATRIRIVVSDDGAGIDARKVLDAAVRQGTVDAEKAARMDRAEILALIFESGVSTSSSVTDISGRGLGMAIARDTVAALGGSVKAESRPGSGTAFTILVPVAHSAFRAVHVEAAGMPFLFPASLVERTLRVPERSLRSVGGERTVDVDGTAVSLADLAEVLGLPRPASRRGPADSPHAVVVRSGGTRLALAVDRVIGVQDVLVKGLGRLLARVRGVSAAAALGSGRTVPILEIHDLVRMARRTGGKPDAGQRADAGSKKRILLAEDSITSRALLSGILESAGYAVRTAVDGAEAWTFLQRGGFDMLISDVEMPRMDGFQLTERIRATEEWAELPVILVTTLDTVRDRERGIEAGADAYIVKSSFDQETLLEVVRRHL